MCRRRERRRKVSVFVIMCALRSWHGAPMMPVPTYASFQDPSVVDSSCHDTALQHRQEPTIM